MITCPKPEPMRTSKRKRRAVKNANIAAVRECVEARDGELCRISRLLERFGFSRPYVRLELAHVAARGMGGNPDLSRDTPENTFMASWDLHNSGKYSMHGGYLKVEAMTEHGTNGPVKVTFYEQLPTEAGCD